MKKDSSTECWNNVNIDELVEKSQNNDFRMFYIMPYTLERLGNVNGKKILDLGCGEGGYSRELAHKGAAVTSADCSEASVRYCKEQALKENLDIQHYIINSSCLDMMNENSFDIVLCAMMLMDVEDLNGTMKEIYRVLKPDGKVFISVLHPCFKGKDAVWKADGEKIHVTVSSYNSSKVWTGEIKGMSAPILYRHRTLSEYVKAFVQNGFRITDMNEPIPTEEQADKSPRIAWLKEIPMYLFIELEK